MVSFYIFFICLRNQYVSDVCGSGFTLVIFLFLALSHFSCVLSIAAIFLPLIPSSVISPFLSLFFFWLLLFVSLLFSFCHRLSFFLFFVFTKSVPLALLCVPRPVLNLFFFLYNPLFVRSFLFLFPLSLPFVSPQKIYSFFL